MTNDNQSAHSSTSSSEQLYDNPLTVGAGGATAYSMQESNKSNTQPSMSSMPQGAQMSGQQYQQYLQSVQAYPSHSTNFQLPNTINTYRSPEQLDFTHNTSQGYTNQSSNYTNDQFKGNSNFNHSVYQSYSQTTPQISSVLPVNQFYAPQNPSQLGAQIISPVNSSHQKGKLTKLIIFLLIGLIAVLCVVCFGVTGFVYFLMQEVRGLKTLETERYTFFYPDKYVQGETVEGEILFINPEKNQIGGNNSIRTFDAESLKGSDKVKDEKTCREFYNSLNNKVFYGIRLNIDSVGYYEFAKTRECSADFSFNAKSLGVDGKGFIKARVIVKDGSQGGVVAAYDDKINEDEKDQLSRSVQLFKIK